MLAAVSAYVHYTALCMFEAIALVALKTKLNTNLVVVYGWKILNLNSSVRLSVNTKIIASSSPSTEKTRIAT